ncbi:MAG: Ig-like domain-containing protein [Sphingobacteriaceae bacterium]|nr:Ig-like domain-containing protein [Sphingobacteriaceae bacterium]
MKYNLLKILSIAIIVLAFDRCAQIGSLTGGKRDSTPPKLLLATPELKTTNFNNDVITLKFDEYVQLRDLNNQLMISPKLKTRPVIEASGKNIIIKFDKSELLPNTTYRFYFGKAICDMHEGNLLINFSYIFSTGSSIDSLNLKGEVMSALKNQKEKDVVIGLYFNRNLTDSFAYKQTPDYVSTTDEQGKFKISNLPAADFRLICFVDKNKDYIYNGADYEQIGFLKEVIQIKSDSSFKLDLFNEIPHKTFIKKVVMNENGKGLVIFNKKQKNSILSFDVTRNEDLYQLRSEAESDTTEFYYRNFKDTLWLKVKYGNDQIDTLKLKVPVIRVRNKASMKLSGNIFRSAINYFEKPTVKLNHWIDSTKTKLERMSLMSKTDTMIGKTKLSISWFGCDQFVINNVLKPKVNYFLKIDTGAFKGYNGFNNDSIKVPFTLLKKSDLGSLVLKITFNSKHAYVVQLLNNANNVIKEDHASFSLSASNTATITFRDVAEGTYRVRIIYDINEDRAWNTGNYLKRVYPEKTYIFEKSIKILPDWEVEQEFSLKE